MLEVHFFVSKLLSCITKWNQPVGVFFFIKVNWTITLRICVYETVTLVHLCLLPCSLSNLRDFLLLNE